MTYRRLALLICLVALASVSLAQEKYAKGDKVKARYAGEVITGRSSRPRPPDFWKLSSTSGQELVRALPPTQILEEEAEPETPAAKPAATPNSPASKTPRKTKPVAGVPSQQWTDTSRSGKRPGGCRTKTRTWVDATGKFKIEAKFIRSMRELSIC